METQNATTILLCPPGKMVSAPNMLTQGFELPSTLVPWSDLYSSLVPPHRSNKVDPNLNPLSSFSALDGRTDEVAKFGGRNERESEQCSALRPRARA